MSAQNANEDGLKGAGIGRVKVVNDSPVVVERYGDEGYWWDSTNNPRYGDVAAYRDERSDYIYAYGGAPNISTGIEQQYAYLTRVKASDAFDLSKYEYWHGRSQQWSSTPLADFNSETAVMYNVGQGQIVWNAHYNTYIFVFMSTSSAPSTKALLTRIQPLVEASLAYEPPTSLKVLGQKLFFPTKLRWLTA